MTRQCTVRMLKKTESKSNATEEFVCQLIAPHGSEGFGFFSMILNFADLLEVGSPVSDELFED
jgi:hypothetical protein